MVDHSRQGIPPNFFGAECRKIKNLNSENFKILRDWATDPKSFILFAGKTGRGKTYAAIATMYFFQYVKNIPWHEQKFIEMSDLNQIWMANFASSEIGSNFSLLEKLKHCKVLILDDIGVKKPTESFLDFIYCLINHRCNDDSLITIFTTNCTSEELNKDFGPRITSRISQGKIAKFEGPDLRMNKF